MSVRYALVPPVWLLPAQSFARTAAATAAATTIASALL